jgi:hypothetical protein
MTATERPTTPRRGTAIILIRHHEPDTERQLRALRILLGLAESPRREQS